MYTGIYNNDDNDDTINSINPEKISTNKSRRLLDKMADIKEINSHFEKNLVNYDDYDVSFTTISTDLDYNYSNNSYTAQLVNYRNYHNRKQRENAENQPNTINCFCIKR